MFRIVGSEWLQIGRHGEFIYEVLPVGVTGKTDKVRARYVFTLEQVEQRAKARAS